jgi:hypothetical protein
MPSADAFVATIPEFIIGRTSRWFDFDSEDANVRINSEVVSQHFRDH